MSSIPADKCAVLVVGVQNEFVSPKGDGFVGGNISEVLSKMNGLLERARSANVKAIIYLQSVRRKDSPEFTFYKLAPHLIEGTWNSEFVELLKPKKGDAIVRTESYDCFGRTEMEKVLKKLDVTPCEDHVVVMGGSINVSIYQCVIGLSQRHYYVSVPLDCTYGPEEVRRLALDTLESSSYDYNVTLTDSEKVEFK
ncbi:MAG: cysteine hydrolase [Nitrososphaerota archaeon]|nr:cysteine hydrolase [Nitrososphaerota archaeon]MDG6923486.1 cysteine hydrolase [Nitrososphaerota archaeon]